MTEHLRNIAAYRAKGMKIKTIASLYNLSTKTISAHLTQIYREFNVKNAIELGIVFNGGRLERDPEQIKINYE